MEKRRKDEGDLAPQVREVVTKLAPALEPIISITAPSSRTTSRQRIAGPGRIVSAEDLGRVQFFLEVETRHCEPSLIEAVVAHELGEFITFIVFGETPEEGKNVALELAREVAVDHFAVVLLSQAGIADARRRYVTVLEAEEPDGAAAQEQLERRLAVLRS